MKKALIAVVALGFVLTMIFLAVTAARAQEMDQRIQALERELARLKNDQAQVKTGQMEMKKQALEAVAALPNFSYRPGGGLLIEAAESPRLGARV